MTKAKMLEAMQDEFNKCMDTYHFFKENLHDEKNANRYWRDARQTERLINMLFGEDIDVYSAYLDTKEF